MKIFKSTVSAIILSSLLTTGIVSGQTTSDKLKTPVQSQQQTTLQSSSKYVIDLSELIKTGQLVAKEGFEREVKLLETKLAGQNKTGTIIVDRYGVKRVPVVENLAVRFMSEDVAPSLRGKRLVFSNRTLPSKARLYYPKLNFSPTAQALPNASQVFLPARIANCANH